MRIWLLLFVSVGVAVAQVPHSNHVWLVTEENHSYENVIGNPSMPYYNSLAKQYGLATQYYAPRHNSLSALMWLVAGQTVTTNNNTTACFDVDNVVRQLLARGLTWKSYQRDLPYAGFEGVSSGGYVRRHNPIIDFTDACSAEQKLNSVPYPQLDEDIAKRTTPNYVYITPNLDEDAHDGSLVEADQWLAQELPAILALPEFKPGGDGLLFVVWDEGNLSGDDRCSARVKSGCGGRVATLVIGPQVKPHFQSSVTYTHANLLRTVCDAMSFTACPGEGALAGPMADFFNTVNINTPLDNAVVASPVRIQAGTTNSSPVSVMQIYVDGSLKYQTAASALDTSFPIPAGKHQITVQSWDNTGGIHKRGITVSVQESVVMVHSPAPNSVVSPPVAIRADASGAATVRQMSIYVDGAMKYQVNGSSVNTKLAMATGVHNLTVQATDVNGRVVKKNLRVTLAAPNVTILSPAANLSGYSPIQMWAKTQDGSLVHALKIYVDDILRYEMTGTGVNTPLALSAGRRHLVFQAWDTAGRIFNKAVDVNILSIPVTISTPQNGATLASPVHIHGVVSNNTPVYAMQVYVDGMVKSKSSGTSIDTSLAMNAGKHEVLVKAWDEGGGTWTSQVSITVK